mgnify:CR=1 FL=1
MDGYVHRSPPPAAFWFLCRRGQRNSPRRAKPSAWNESLPKNRRAGQRPAPTTSQAKYSKIGQRAHTVRPYGVSGRTQQNRAARRGRPHSFFPAGKQHPKAQPQRGPVDQRKRYRPPLTDPEAHPHGQQADRHAERPAPEIGPPPAREKLGIFILLEPLHPAGEGPLFKPIADRYPGHRHHITEEHP